MARIFGEKIHEATERRIFIRPREHATFVSFFPKLQTRFLARIFGGKIREERKRRILIRPTEAATDFHPKIPTKKEGELD